MADDPQHMPEPLRKAPLPTKKLYVPVLALLSVLIVVTIYWQDQQRARSEQRAVHHETAVQTIQSDRVIREEVARQFDEGRRVAERRQQSATFGDTHAAPDDTHTAPGDTHTVLSDTRAAPATALRQRTPATPGARPDARGPWDGWRGLSADVREAAASSGMVVLNRSPDTPRQTNASAANANAARFPDAASEYKLLREAIAAAENSVVASGAPGDGGTPEGGGTGGNDRAAVNNEQRFLSRQRAARAAAAPQSLVAPPHARGRVVHEGTVIRAVLLSAVDSALPGPVIAQVAAPVYDSVTGRTVVIPRGARLIGDYNTSVRPGHKRLQLAFRRLLYPDGSSVAINGSPGGAPDGSVGVRGKLKNGLLRALGSGLLVTWLTEEAEKRGNRGRATAAPANGAVHYTERTSRSAEVIADTGTRALAPYTRLYPRITVAPGTLISVITNRDVLLQQT